MDNNSNLNVQNVPGGYTNNQGVQLPIQNIQNQNFPNQNFQNQNFQNQNFPNQNFNPNQNFPNQNFNPNMQYQMQQPGINVNQPYLQMQPMVNPMMNQGWEFMNGCLYTIDPLESLKYAKAVIIKQKMELFEMFTGFQTPNRYYVLAKDPETGTKTFLFKCQEESDTCMRLCCSGSMRSFKMKIKHPQNLGDFNSNSTFAVLDRPFQCTCCCLARPEMTATINSQYVGKVYEPCTFCDPLFHVIDKDKKTKYKIHTSYCQCGICCRNDCGKCSDVTFPIYPADADLDKGNADGFVKKCFQTTDLISEANTFYIEFPSKATAEDKFMIIATTLMIDYAYYEEVAGAQHHRY